MEKCKHPNKLDHLPTAEHVICEVSQIPQFLKTIFKMKSVCKSSKIPFVKGGAWLTAGGAVPGSWLPFAICISPVNSLSLTSVMNKMKVWIKSIPTDPHPLKRNANLCLFLCLLVFFWAGWSVFCTSIVLRNGSIWVLCNTDTFNICRVWLRQMHPWRNGWVSECSKRLVSEGFVKIQPLKAAAPI